MAGNGIIAGIISGENGKVKAEMAWWRCRYRQSARQRQWRVANARKINMALMAARRSASRIARKRIARRGSAAMAHQSVVMAAWRNK